MDVDYNLDANSPMYLFITHFVTFLKDGYSINTDYLKVPIVPDFVGNCRFFPNYFTIFPDFM